MSIILRKRLISWTTMLGYLPLFHRFTLFMTMFVKIGFVIGKLLDSCGVRAARSVRFGVRGGLDSSCW
jgi:hypothetical protein